MRAEVGAGGGGVPGCWPVIGVWASTPVTAGTGVAPGEVGRANAVKVRRNCSTPTAPGRSAKRGKLQAWAVDSHASNNQNKKTLLGLPIIRYSNSSDRGIYLQVGNGKLTTSFFYMKQIHNLLFFGTQ